MEANFSPRVKDVITFSREEALRLGHDYIGTEHFLLGIIREGEGTAIRIIKSLGVTVLDLRKKVEQSIAVDNSKNNSNGNIPLVKQAEKTLKITYLEAKLFKSNTIGTEHLLLSILKDDNNVASRALRHFNVNYDMVKNELDNLADDNEFPIAPKAEFPNTPSDDDEEVEDEFSRTSKKPVDPKSKTPVLDNFGRDLTKMGEEGKLDPIVGREKEIERVSQILSRRKKNNPILIGEPGVGKSAIAEGLALRITQKKVSRVLFGIRVVTLDLASLVAGTKYRGQFEERMKAVMNELQKSPEVILFIDEIHTIIGAGGASGSMDASNMFKPALARGEIQCIGATTLDEFRQHIEKDGALERRFQKVLVEATSIEETIEILGNIKEKYEEHHNVNYTKEAVEACVKLTNRYISDRHLPDKAIDALDEAGSRVHITNIKVPKAVIELEGKIEDIKEEKNEVVRSQKYEEAAQLRDKERQLLEQLDIAQKKWEEETKSHREIVTEDNVAEVVAMMTGVPIQRIAQKEGNRLVNMFEEMQGSVIGQDDAIKKVVKAIQRNRAGLKDPNKPIGSFIFLGPTGVGKTQLAKVLSNFLFDNEDALIRIDMSEYMEKFAISRLVGAPPGYVGYEEGGQLTEKVRRRPYSVVLLDEIEKAHPDVFNLLLQALDDGQITDSLGRKIDFKNTIIIMTSNIGARQLKDFGSGVGFGTKAKENQASDLAKGVIEGALKKAFAPEFLNRIDDVVMFNSLNKANIHEIIDIELNGLYGRINELGYKVKITSEAKDFIADKGFDSQFGARPLKRAIQKLLEDPLAEEIIKSNLQEGDTINVGLKNDEITIKISKPKKKKEKE
ncbi:MAG: ATP-dependent Clp protease ATP-binding subunit [Flavobacteriales bacterium]|nr:ATP-dependent Clp protease ATP-binding subunit [Flavobacteriales bacterium]